MHGQTASQLHASIYVPFRFHFSATAHPSFLGSVARVDPTRAHFDSDDLSRRLLHSLRWSIDNPSLPPRSHGNARSWPGAGASPHCPSALRSPIRSANPPGSTSTCLGTAVVRSKKASRSARGLSPGARWWRGFQGACAKSTPLPAAPGSDAVGTTHIVVGPQLTALLPPPQVNAPLDGSLRP